MNDFDLWQKFTATGSVLDYLQYKQLDNKVDVKNANTNQGIDNKRTNGW